MEHGDVNLITVILMAMNFSVWALKLFF